MFTCDSQLTTSAEPSEADGFTQTSFLAPAFCNKGGRPTITCDVAWKSQFAASAKPGHSEANGFTQTGFLSLSPCNK